MKVLHIFFSFLMLSFAALQWNDPDRVIWIGIYVATALMALIAFTEVCKSCVQAWAIMLSIISLIMLIQTLPGVITFVQTSNYGEIFSPMTEDKPYIEQVREFLGLLIVMIYSIYVAILFYKSQLNHRNQ